MPDMQAAVRSVIRRDLARECETLARGSMRLVDGEEMTRIANSSLVTLRHAIPHHVGQTITQAHLLWDIRSLLSRADQLVEARDAVLRCLARLNWTVDTVVALSAPAVPLAALIASDPRFMPTDRSRLYYLDNYTGQLSLPGFEPHQRVLLFDTLVRTGWHLSTGYELVKAMGGSIVGVFTLCLGARDEDDVWSMSELAINLLAKGELGFAYSWRQLMSIASAMPEPGQTRPGAW